MKFSVVICTYNYANLLPDALHTVAAQTMQNFELLIVDDGSTDNTEEVVEQFRLQFENLRYLKKPHTGPGDSRNVGVQAATGTHIAFLDADDLWSRHYLATMQKAFSENPQAEIALCEPIFIRSEHGTVTEATLRRRLPQLSGPINSARKIFDVIQTFSPSGMAFSKDLYSRIGPFDVQSFGWFSEDVDWLFRALHSGAFCLCLQQRLYLYRRHDDNLTNNAGNSFHSWLKLYSQTFRDSRADTEFENLARGVIHSRALRFLPSCSTARGKSLLKEATETLGGDLFIKLCYVGTFLGLRTFMKCLKQSVRFTRRLLKKRLAINLATSSEKVFEIGEYPPS